MKNILQEIAGLESQERKRASAQAVSSVRAYLEKLGAPFFDAESQRRLNGTPVAEITRVLQSYAREPPPARIFLKEEYKNPLTNSVKGRAVASMLLAEIGTETPFRANGEWKRWIEPTSGNTGVGLAEIAGVLKVPEFTAVISRLDISGNIRKKLDQLGARVLTIGSEYSLADLEVLAKSRGKRIQYYWSTPRHISPDSLALFTKALEKFSPNARESEARELQTLKELDPIYFLDKLLTPAAEALRTPLIARIAKGEYDEIKKSIAEQIPELSRTDSIVAFLCPLGNTSMALNTFLSQLGFGNVTNVKGGIDALRSQSEDNGLGNSSEYCPLPGASISASSIDFVKKLEKENPEGYFTFMQYENPENVKAHMLTTGPELADQLPELKGVVCTFGTGGSATGLSRYFHDKGVKVFVAFPKRPVEGIRTLRGAEGLAFFQPGEYGGIIEVDNEAASKLWGFLLRKGVGVGPSTAIAVQAALDLHLPGDCAIIAADGIQNYAAEYASLLET